MDSKKKFVKVYKSEKIVGGKGDGKKPKDFDPKALAQGTKHELEHTTSKKIAMEIAMDHLTEDPNYYKKLKKIEKSYDYNDHGVMIDSKDQHAAEENGNQELIQYLKSNTKPIGQFEVVNCEFAKGKLVLTKKDAGLFNGFFKDIDGQIVEKFTDQTVEMIAKNMILKDLYDVPEPPETVELKEDRPTHISIRFGDFEMEIRKSLSDFVKNWKSPGKSDIKKSVKVWRKSVQNSIHLKTEKDAVKELLDNWEMHKEGFNQILFGVQQLKRDK